jgi:hypothetical protein
VPALVGTFEAVQCSGSGSGGPNGKPDTSKMSLREFEAYRQAEHVEKEEALLTVECSPTLSPHLNPVIRGELTMANTILTIDDIAREALMLLRSTLVGVKLFDRRYEANFTGNEMKGDTIRIRRRGSGTVREFTSSITVDDITESNVEPGAGKALRLVVRGHERSSGRWTCRASLSSCSLRTY